MVNLLRKTNFTLRPRGIHCVNQDVFFQAPTMVLKIKLMALMGNIMSLKVIF